MTAEEIKIAIARACGYELLVSISEVKRHAKHVWPKKLPDYPNDANAALEFARQLASEGWRAEAGMGTDGTWECTFYKEASAKTHADNKGKREGVVTEEHYGAGDTLALAICKAGLGAKGLWHDT